MHKPVNGRKRHIVVDALGLLLLVIVNNASLPDGNGGKQTLTVSNATFAIADVA